MTITYTVQYKHTKDLFWRRLRNVEGDGYVFNEKAGTFGIRYFNLSDGTRIEIPTTDIVFKFHPDRRLAIKDNMNKQMGKI